MNVKLAAGAIALALAASPALARSEGHEAPEAPPPPPVDDPHGGLDLSLPAGARPLHSGHAMTGALGPCPSAQGCFFFASR